MLASMIFAVLFACGSAQDPSCAYITAQPQYMHPGVPQAAAEQKCRGDCAQPGYNCETVADYYPTICTCGSSPSTPSPTPPPPAPAPGICTNPAYHQCGGNAGFSGETCCPAGQVCHRTWPGADQYWQCCPPDLHGCGAAFWSPYKNPEATNSLLAATKATTATNLTASMEQSIRATCEQQCQSSGYTCKSCTNTNCASSYNHPSCAMGCYMGHLSKTVQACESACDKGDNQCGWTFRATLMSNCQGSDNCPNQNRRGSSNAECKAGCRQATIRAPQMDSQAALQAVNRIRSRYGKAPMTWRADKKSCADKAAAYNSKHGPHKCGIDGVCKCGDRAAGDFNANDFVDAINRAYATRNSEGPADGTCDERSHCGALLAYSSIVVGYDENKFLAVIQYY